MSLISPELANLGLLKFELLASGLRISPSASSQLEKSKGIIRTRSGSSGGLDVVLPMDIHINCPVVEGFASDSELELCYTEGDFVITRGGQILSQATLIPKPQYYHQTTSNGVASAKIGQMCSADRFCFGMTGSYCFFWKKDRRCQYCSIGLNKSQDASQKTIEAFLEVLMQAVTDPVLPAKHILIGGGTPDGEDMGALLAASLCKAVKSKFNISCYVMISAPLKNEYIDILYDSGADELGMNMEFFSDTMWQDAIPGKAKLIGKQRYLDALEYSVSLFGPIKTRSILIAGLEAAEHTIEGAELLASMGVMPIISPFRPLAGTAFENRKGFSHVEYWKMFETIVERTAKYDIPVGPTCIACQNNVLALPINDAFYRHY